MPLEGAALKEFKDLSPGLTPFHPPPSLVREEWHALTLPFHFVLRVRFATTNLVIKISGRLLNYLRVKSYRLWHLL